MTTDKNRERATVLSNGVPKQSTTIHANNNIVSLPGDATGKSIDETPVTNQKWTHLATPNAIIADGDQRRGSVLSQKSSTSTHNDSTESPVHETVTNVVTTADDTPDDGASQTTGHNDSYNRSAIPYLPLSAAVLCFLLNIFVPGTGTILSGICALCCGKPRIQDKAGQRMATLCVNAMVGTAQMFTVSFMLVGWFWSFTWGIYMLILAVEHNKSMKEQRKKTIQANALGAMSTQVRPWTLKTS